MVWCKSQTRNSLFSCACTNLHFAKIDLFHSTTTRSINHISLILTCAFYYYYYFVNSLKSKSFLPPFSLSLPIPEKHAIKLMVLFTIEQINALATGNFACR